MTIQKINSSDQPQTIASLATLAGRSALAVIRVSGEDAHKIFADIICEKNKFENESARKIGLYNIVETDGGKENSPQKIIDDVTAIKYSAPHSFTGENMVEIFSHGGTVIPHKILRRLFDAGATAATRGEFTHRAFENGKIDLLKAESIASLIDSQTTQHFMSAQFAYSGKMLSLLELLKKRIISIQSDFESFIEFEEDDSAISDTARNENNLRELRAIICELEEELRRREKIVTLDGGLKIAIAGPANAGKSSLMNELLGYDRSIVHATPGTTRDAISEKIVLNGVTATFFDCAGIRETADAVEQLGIERTKSAIKDAQAVIWVTPANVPFGEFERQDISEHKDKAIVVINKIDLARAEEKRLFCADNSLPYVEVSLKEKTNIENLHAALVEVVERASADISPPELIVNERHHRIVSALVAELRSCVEHYGRAEVCAHYLKNALGLMSEFLGHTAPDEVLNDIFDKFCIGK